MILFSSCLTHCIPFEFILIGVLVIAEIQQDDNSAESDDLFVCLFVLLIMIFNVALTIFQSYRYDVCCEAAYSDV